MLHNQEQGAAALKETAGTKPTTRKAPSMATLNRWMNDGGAEATDGCWVEPDGRCSHGCESWLIVLGLI